MNLKNIFYVPLSDKDWNTIIDRHRKETKAASAEIKRLGSGEKIPNTLADFLIRQSILPGSI